jgi:hypothetical protein
MHNQSQCVSYAGPVLPIRPTEPQTPNPSTPLDGVCNSLIRQAESKRDAAIDAARREFNDSVLQIRNLVKSIGGDPNDVPTSRRGPYKKNIGLRGAIREFVSRQTGEFTNSDIAISMAKEFPGVDRNRVGIEMKQLQSTDRNFVTCRVGRNPMGGFSRRVYRRFEGSIRVKAFAE